MPRQKNTRPTNIYWLCDMRPEEVAIFGSGGHPFYCGKTVSAPSTRLKSHRCDARRYPDDPHSKRIAACGEFIGIRVVEVVPPEENWCVRECYWISTIRALYPGGTNILAGGQGAPGWIPSAEFREKARLAQVHRNKSPEHRAKISAALTGRKFSPETRAKLSAARRGGTQSPESNAKRSATQSGRKRPPEAVAKTAAGLRGKKHPPERCAKNSAVRKGIKTGPRSPEVCAQISARKKAWWADPVNRERASARQIGRVLSVETREKISAAQRARLAKAHV
jgi:NUMOD3 motif